MRSLWRHEQQSIRMALGAAARRSAQQYAALRGPTTGTRAREGATLHGDRTHLTGEAPGILAELRPLQRSDRPTLALPTLAGSAGVLRFPTASALEAKRKLEEEKEKELEKRRELVALLDVPRERRTPAQHSRIQTLTREVPTFSPPSLRRWKSGPTGGGRGRRSGRESF